MATTTMETTATTIMETTATMMIATTTLDTRRTHTGRRTQHREAAEQQRHRREPI
jgi:hypothetical protein